LQLRAYVCVCLSLQKSNPHFNIRVGAMLANKGPFTHQLANHMCPNSFVWEGYPEAPKLGIDKREPHLEYQLLQLCIGGYSTLPKKLVHRRPIWGDDADAEGLMDDNGEDPMETDHTLQPSALVYINLEPEPMQMVVQSPDYERNLKMVGGYEALVVNGKLPHGMMTVPAPAAFEKRSLCWVWMGRLRTVYQSKEGSQMTHKAPIAMSDPCVYNPTHMWPWVGPEGASRNIGNKMMSVFATLEGGGLRNYAFASGHALNRVCYAENIRLAPARLDNRPISASASALADETVKIESVIDDSDSANSDSDSDKKPAAVITKKKSVCKAQAAPKKKPTPTKKPAKIHGVNDDASFVSVGSEKSTEVSSDADVDAKQTAIPKPLSIFEHNRNREDSGNKTMRQSERSCWWMTTTIIVGRCCLRCQPVTPSWANTSSFQGRMWWW
jgi:hypothetical protein